MFPRGEIQTILTFSCFLKHFCLCLKCVGNSLYHEMNPWLKTFLCPIIWSVARHFLGIGSSLKREASFFFFYQQVSNVIMSRLIIELMGVYSRRLRNVRSEIRFSGKPLDVEMVSYSGRQCSVLVLCGHLFMGYVDICLWIRNDRIVLCVCVCPCMCVSTCVCVPQQFVVSCEWTWLRRRYLRKDRNREWWFTCSFLRHVALFPLVSASPLPWVLRPRRDRNPCLDQKQRYKLQNPIPLRHRCLPTLIYPRVTTLNMVFVTERITISRVRAEKLTAGLGRTTSMHNLFPMGPCFWWIRYVNVFTLALQTHLHNVLCVYHM